MDGNFGTWARWSGGLVLALATLCGCAGTTGGSQASCASQVVTTSPAVVHPGPGRVIMKA